MALLERSSLIIACPRNQHCVEWARVYIRHCLCSVKSGLSLALGLISVISWSVAEVPQIITNYREKSTEGLSVGFLITWIIGDLFNLFGCMLEPATLPTQYYMAVLYTLTTMILAAQTIYYGLIFPQFKYNRECHKSSKHYQSEAVAKVTKSNNDVGVVHVSSAARWGNGPNAFDSGNVLSSPIPLPAAPVKSSLGREFYYMSARSLSRSHTPTAGSFLLAQRMTHSFHTGNPVEEPLLYDQFSTQSAPSASKSILCLVPVLILFIGTFNSHSSANSRLNLIHPKTDQNFVVRLERKLFQVSGGLLQENVTEGSSMIGAFLGWAMAGIYMGGRLPQIYLNMKRGNVEGLSPLMFLFALIGNATYVASILVNSMDWSRIRPNLPWLVDAGGCVLLDTFILVQFIFYYCRSPQHMHGHSNTA